MAAGIVISQAYIMSCARVYYSCQPGARDVGKVGGDGSGTRGRARIYVCVYVCV